MAPTASIALLRLMAINSNAGYVFISIGKPIITCMMNFVRIAVSKRTDAFSSFEYTSAEALMRNADIAMYRAKDEGKARYTIFDQTMYDETRKLVELENNLRLALERDQFALHYQPIISLENNRLVGFEALIRWQHPQRGSISPVEFIPIAEDTGLIIAIGEWLLREACQQLQLWRQYTRSTVFKDEH